MTESELTHKRQIDRGRALADERKRTRVPFDPTYRTTYDLAEHD